MLHTAANPFGSRAGADNLESVYPSGIVVQVLGLEMTNEGRGSRRA